MTPLNIMVGLSGGVDSAVATFQLQKSGHRVQALFMKNWEEDDDEKYCSAKLDLEDAEAVAQKLNIPLHTRNFSGEYWQNVFQHFLTEYKNGRTPNPDVLCNKEIKFKVFLEHALDLGAEYIATGHYARIETRDDQFHLLKSVDKNKDQSYFLHLLDQYQLSKSVFPLGDIDKPRVRQIAQQQGFQNYDKKDSTGICFIGERKFKDFLSQFLPAQPGNICDPLGTIIGAHEGLMYYTLGQRQGLGIGGTATNSSGDPWYVVAKDLDNNILIAAQGINHPLLFSRSLLTGPVHWIVAPPRSGPYSCFAKTRYRQPDQACEISNLNENSCLVTFKQPQRAVTPGQSVVFYQGDECLGGAVIEKTFSD